MKFFGIEIAKELVSPWMIRLLFAILFIWLIAKLFGKKVLKAFSKFPRGYRHTDWIADCKERNGRLQRCDFEHLPLHGRRLHMLEFKIEPLNPEKNWRAGLIIGNPQCRPELVVDSTNAILCHTGEPPAPTSGKYIWAFDLEHTREQPYSTSVKILSSTISFSCEVSNNNFLRIGVENQSIYEKRIDSSFRKKLYLIAWGDSDNCKVKFTDIYYQGV